MSDKFIKLERNFTITKSLDEAGEFEGYASVFDTVDDHGDIVKAGAFKEGLKQLAKAKKKIKMLFNHDRYQPIGVFKEADEDSNGLYVRGKLTLGVQKADETRLLMLDGAIDSMSIGGYLRKQKTNERTGVRELLEIELLEISPVVFPALDSARIVSVKSLADGAPLADVEMVLRDAGFSIKEAKRLISIIKGSAPQRDVDGATIETIRSAINSLKG